MRQRARSSVLVILTALISACSAPGASLVTEPGFEAERVHRFGDLYLASQPSEADLHLAKALGVRTLVNQRRPEEKIGFDERATAEGLGLAYANPAFRGAHELTDGVLDESLDLLRGADRPLLIHCASANRTGAIWLAYRVLDGGLDFDAALGEARQVGLRSPDYEAVVRDYVERRRPAAEAPTE
jgi:protein tyrosine phosphatase (PTP) superfamily phosphohydrolase (DUF442 family)